MDDNENLSDLQKGINLLFTAELQFRLASAVNLAVNTKVQPLDLPQEWTHGTHRVQYDEIALRQDQAEYAVCFLQKSSTFQMASAIQDALWLYEEKPFESKDQIVVSAYNIAKLIRDSFSHSVFRPVWDIRNNYLKRSLLYKIL